MKAFKVISNPEAFQLLADETRRKMIYLLRAKEMTVSQIAESMNLTPQAIYHHIRKLKDVDMIEIAKEERVGHFIETYYRSTAEVFHLSHGVGESAEYIEGEVKEAMDGLKKLGMKVNCMPEKMSEVLKIVKEMKDPFVREEWADRISTLEDVDFLARQAVFEYANLLSMSDKDFEGFLKNYRELRKLLRTCVEIPDALMKAGHKKEQPK
jgi:DNA-binding transcriptional ArsR family regulator